MDIISIAMLVWLSFITVILLALLGWAWFLYRMADETKWEGRKLRARLNAITDTGDHMVMGPVDHTIKDEQKIEMAMDIMRFIDDSKVP